MGLAHAWAMHKDSAQGRVDLTGLISVVFAISKSMLTLSHW